MSSEQLVYTSDPELLWEPGQDGLADTNIHKFTEKVRAKYQIKLDNYNDLYNWSVEKYSEFWGEVWDYLDVIHSKTYDSVVDKTKNISDIPSWFQGSRLNFAENLLRCQDDKVAIYAAVEGYNNIGDLRKKTFKDMREDVRRFAAAMKSFGVKEGDRVVGYLPNSIEAVEAMLAAASIGAVWSSCSPEFGVSGVLERFSQIQPKLIFSVDGVIYNGKKHDQMEKLQQIVKGLPDLLCVVVVPYVSQSPDLKGIPNSCVKEDFLKKGLQPDGSYPPLEFKQLPFNHPLFIMYSSGTTGTPKCMVHSAGGTLLKHLEEHILQGNMKKNDVMMYFTTTGWMMWNWSVSSLAVGSTLVCYDGSPLAPNVDTLWKLMSDLKVTVLGTGAKWLSVVEENGLGPKPCHDLSHLHTILSTGSPLKPQSFAYVYEAIKKEVVLGSITGGTDIIACFAGITRILPVRKGEIQCRYLGMAVESWDEEGKSVTGESGELVCTKPFPSMPIYFLNDPDGKKYRAAYFDKFPGVWAHGDFCIINSQTGGIWMLGRSDGTLNPSGVRFGSAEIYHIVESFKEISDSLCVGQKSGDGMDERVVLFLKMASGVDFTPDLVKQVQQSIRKQLSPRHVPPVVLETPDIPYTYSGKKVEIAVKRIISGEKVKPSSALANPQSLDFYRDIPLLKGY